MNKDKALELALEALEEAYEIVGAAWTWRNEKGRPAVTAIKQALAAPEQEPVAAQCKFDREVEWGWCEIAHHNLVQSEPRKWPGYQTRLLYTTPPAAQRQCEGCAKIAKP